jgi:hypothetical protein
MKLHRNSLKNLFINHHIHLKLGVHQAKNNSHHVDDLMEFFFANPALFISQHTSKHSIFLLILQNKLSCVLEQEKALKVGEFIELVIRNF